MFVLSAYASAAQIDAGWSSLAARRAHNPKVVGSNPTPATTHAHGYYAQINHREVLPNCLS